ncbi:MAG: membrane protein insertase YidC [Rhodospirillaceae bacterium]|nr:membrane protein insertase YidC [Rhodospirillaceae bacterium]
MMDQRNLILAIVLSVSILLGFQVFIEGPRIEEQRALQEAQKAKEAAQTINPAIPGQVVAPIPGQQSIVPTPGAVPPGAGAPVAGQPAAARSISRAAIVSAEPRIKITTDRVIGSIRLKGGLIDDLTLLNYRQTLEKDSENIVMLSPLGTENPYYAQFGWTSTTTGVTLPNADTVWTTDRSTLSVGQPVTLRWTNPEGIEFAQVISIDENFMFAVDQRITNNGNQTAVIHPFGLISLSGMPETAGFWILHEGMIGVFDETLTEVDYDDLPDEPNGIQAVDGAAKWLGITAKYFATSLVPDQKVANKGRFVHTAPGGKDKFQADYLAASQTVAPGQSAAFSTRLFAGAKEVRLLDSYEEKLGIPRFDRMVDFGWFYFLTKPIFYAIDYFYQLLGNFGLAILLLTVLIKLAFFPLANKSYKSMSRLKKLQPKMVEIREKHKDDRQRQNTAMMELYKKEGANPMSGCFPILIQIPVFFALYKVLFVTIEMRHAPFFGWIQDLSAPDPYGLLIGFGLFQWDVPQSLQIVNVGIWPIIMGVTMFLQQRLNPQPADPMQQKIFMLLPIVFTFLLGSFPAGLVIYWAWNNTLSIAQQWVIMRKMGVSASGQSINEEPPKPPPRGNKKKKDGSDDDEEPASKPGPTPPSSKGKTRRQRKKR